MKYIIKEDNYNKIKDQINHYYFTPHLRKDAEVTKNISGNYELTGKFNNVPFKYDYHEGVFTSEKDLSEDDVNDILKYAYAKSDILKENTWFGFSKDDYRLEDLNKDKIRGKITQYDIKEISSLSNSIKFYTKDISDPKDISLNGTYETSCGTKMPIPYFLSKNKDFIASAILVKSGFKPIPEYKKPENSISEDFVGHDVSISKLVLSNFLNNKDDARMSVFGKIADIEFCFNYSNSSCLLDINNVREATPEEYIDIISSIVFDNKAYDNSKLFIYNNEFNFEDNIDIKLLNNNKINFMNSTVLDFDVYNDKFRQIIKSDVGLLPGPKPISDAIDNFINKEVDKQIETAKINTYQVADKSIKFYSKIKLPSNIVGSVSGNYDPISKTLKLDPDYNTTENIKEKLLVKTAQVIDEREKNETLYPENLMDGKVQNLFTLESLLEKADLNSRSNNIGNISLYLQDDKNVRFNIDDREIYGTFNLSDNKVTDINQSLSQNGTNYVEQSVSKAITDELKNVTSVLFDKTNDKYNVFISAGESICFNLNGTYENGKLNIPDYNDKFLDGITDSVNEAFANYSSRNDIKARHNEQFTENKKQLGKNNNNIDI